MVFRTALEEVNAIVEDHNIATGVTRLYKKHIKLVSGLNRQKIISPSDCGLQYYR